MNAETIVAANPELLKLGIIPKTIVPMPFQGEMSKVLSAESKTHGTLIIKTAIIDKVVLPRGVEEIETNIQGYNFIPTRFCPEILFVNKGKTIMVMKNAGIPFRDLLWENQHDLNTCESILRGLEDNLIGLLLQTKNEHAANECKAFLEKLRTLGNLFLEEDFFPDELRIGFNTMLNKALAQEETIGAFASIDATQGNLLIDNTQKPNTLKLIDPKLPREVNGTQNFTGIPEVDLGMFFITVELNSPKVLEDLDLDETLIRVSKIIHHGEEKVRLYIDLGKAFGCILIATFPNSVERVEKYLQSFGVDLDERRRTETLDERQRHIKKALKITKNHEE